MGDAAEGSAQRGAGASPAQRGPCGEGRRGGATGAAQGGMEQVGLTYITEGSDGW